MLDMLAHEIDVLRLPTHPQAWTFARPQAKLKVEAMQEIYDKYK